MSDKLMTIEVRGKQKTWLFSFHADTAYLKEWRDDGLKVELIEAVIPANCPVPVSWWVFWQKVFNFRNPWGK